MADAQWTIRGGRVLGPAPLFGMGIVNVTPDSFYDGGRHWDGSPDSTTGSLAVAHARRLAEQGADILDIGGESTRPGAGEVDAEAEQARVVPVLRALDTERRAAGASAMGRVALSVDTYKAATAEAALEAGADIVNDISGCRFDPALLDVVAGRKPGYVLMHSQGRPGTMQDAPRYDDVVDEIRAFFVERMQALTRAGLPEERIVLDPGIGFGKTLAHNLDILRRMGELVALGRPLLVGLSNKSLWGHLLGLDVYERAGATQAATAIMAARGVAVHRVHDVADTAQTLRIARELAPTGPETGRTGEEA